MRLVVQQEDVSTPLGGGWLSDPPASGKLRPLTSG